MARSLNKVLLIGNLGNDPEVRSTNGGNRVASFSLATSRQWNDKAGEKQEKTEWHRCVAWGKPCDIIEQYARKGSKMYVEGSVEYRQWTDKEGATRYATEINVREFVLLGDPNRAASDGAPRALPSAAKAAPAGGGAEDFPGALEDDDDDLPF